MENSTPRRRREESTVRAPVDVEVVIPAYNETGRLPRTLAAMTGYLETLPWSARIVVVDNGSSDDTAGIVPTGRRHRGDPTPEPPERHESPAPSTPSTGRHARPDAAGSPNELAEVLAEVLARSTEPVEREIAAAELGAARMAALAPTSTPRDPLEPPPPAALVAEGEGQAAVAALTAVRGLGAPAPVGTPTTVGSVEVVVIGCVRAGKGAAVLRGLRTSAARFVGFTDSDLSTPLDTLEPALAALEEGATAAIASRHVAGSQFAEAQPLTRRLGGGVFRAAARSLVPGVRDTQCGFKFFDRQAAEKAFWATRSTGFAFDVELLQRIHVLGGRIVEIPVTWTDEAGSSLSTFDGVAAVAEVVRLRRHLPRTPQQARPADAGRAGETDAERRRAAPSAPSAPAAPTSPADDPAARRGRPDGPRHARRRTDRS